MLTISQSLVTVMSPDTGPLAPPPRSIAEFIAAAFSTSEDRALRNAAAELDEDVRTRLRTFWRVFDRNFAEWSAEGFDASDEWWEEKIERFEEAENEIVEIVEAFDRAFEQITERWNLTETERHSELLRAREAFNPIMLKLARASRDAREQLIALYGQKKAGHRVNMGCETAEDVDRAFAKMGF